jgi:hypothetical protein
MTPLIPASDDEVHAAAHWVVRPTTLSDWDPHFQLLPAALQWTQGQCGVPRSEVRVWCRIWRPTYLSEIRLVKTSRIDISNSTNDRVTCNYLRLGKI